MIASLQRIGVLAGQRVFWVRFHTGRLGVFSGKVSWVRSPKQIGPWIPDGTIASLQRIGVLGQIPVFAGSRPDDSTARFQTCERVSWVRFQTGRLSLQRIGVLRFQCFLGPDRTIESSAAKFQMCKSFLGPIPDWTILSSSADRCLQDSSVSWVQTGRLSLLRIGVLKIPVFTGSRPDD